MTLIRFSIRRAASRAVKPDGAAQAVFCRFFRLIERLEAPQHATEAQAPEVKARITRIDGSLHRPG